MLTPFALTLACHAAAALAGIGGRRTLPFVYGLSAAASAMAALTAAAFLAAGAPPETARLPIGLPWLGANLRIDALSGFFLLVVNLGAALISLYALEYGQHDAEPGRVLPVYPAFLAGMNLVLVADDAFVFLVSWEFMSLTSWLLVLANHRQRETAGAAFLYLVMASFGTGALLLAFGVMSGGVGSYAFTDLRTGTLAPMASGLLFALAILGAGSKAGLMPLHVWLPPAHSAAPSHVSALMSGLMTKVAVYGLIRIVFDLAGQPDWWWGAVLLLLGGITAPLGVLYAVMQSDMKRLLAYSTVENIGIVTIGLGLALAFRANHLDTLAALALMAALLHVFNHAQFKSLLFLGAGAVLVATGERDMDRLGGLVHRMPVTTIAVLAGAASISALPPFNGFVSEWLTFQAVIAGAALPQWLLKFAVPATGALLALAAAFAGVGFVKLFGIAFLGRPRSSAAADAREVGPLMLAPMAALAAICAVAGVMPGAVLALMRPIVAMLLPGAALPAAPGFGFSVMPLGAGHGAYNGFAVLIAIALMAGLGAFVIHRFGSNRTRRAPPWDCGFPDARAELQYTASGFAQPIRRIFGSAVFGARERVDMPRPGDLRPAHYALAMRDPVWHGLYLPVARLVSAAADRLNALQFLTVRRCLGLMFGALIALLLIVAVSQ